MVDVEKLVETLRRVVERGPQIKLMYLFGSYAEGRAMPISDIDIALVTSERNVIPHVVADQRTWSSRGGDIGARPRGRFADVSSGSPEEGVRIVDRGGEGQRLLAGVGPETLELNELSEIHFARWVEG